MGSLRIGHECLFLTGARIFADFEWIVEQIFRDSNLSGSLLATPEPLFWPSQVVTLAIHPVTIQH